MNIKTKRDSGNIHLCRRKLFPDHSNTDINIGNSKDDIYEPVYACTCCHSKLHVRQSIKFLTQSYDFTSATVQKDTFTKHKIHC